MESVYIALFAFLLSIYIVSQPATDARTKTTWVIVVAALSALFLKLSAIWVFIYVALGLLSAMVVSYWASRGLLHFPEPAHRDYPVPLWLPAFFTLGFLTVHVFYAFVGTRMELED